MTASRLPASTLLNDALRIWHAGVDAVDSARLVREAVTVSQDGIRIAGHPWDPAAGGRICVVGAGKAGAGMAAGFEDAIGPEGLSKTTGWVNIPEDCLRSLQKIHLHGARPAGVNEPTAAGVAGTRRILELVSQLGPQDLCLVLISGGGSALLPAPAEGVSLDEKLRVTRSLMRQGATIAELNCVRRSLSAVKGGGLLRACMAGTIIALIISDVIGDPLETIASGPTVACNPEPERALEILETFATGLGADIPRSVLHLLQSRARCFEASAAEERRVFNCVIGNNRTAVEASAAFARTMGYEIASEEWDQPGEAATAGREFANRLISATETTPDQKLCFVSGGETTVRLAANQKVQKGGRNQEFALAAVIELMNQRDFSGAIVSGGTDGEDGPTDAAGAFLQGATLEQVRKSGIDAAGYLAANNSYHFFEQFGSLLKTGPTHTNVMDLRVGLVSPDHGFSS